MRKLNTVLTGLIVTMLIATAVPASATIQSYNWISPLVKNQFDDFYGATITGYEALTTATLIVNINDHLGSDMNISAIKVWFDWGVNYTDSSLVSMFNESNPFVIKSGEAHVFTVNFDLPDTTVASNLVTHSFRIYVEDVNATSGSVRQLNSNPSVGGSGFAVFSDTQVQAITLERDISIYTAGMTTFMTSKGRQLYQQAQFMKGQGDNAYTKGDFSGAVTYYENATSLFEAAWGNETGKISAFEDAFLNMINAGQNVLNMMGVGYALFGVGFLFMGIGVLVYLVRKSGQPKAPPQ